MTDLFIEATDDAITAQRKRVDAAWQAWDRADTENEHKMWELLEQHSLILNAMLRIERIENPPQPFEVHALRTLMPRGANANVI